MGVTDLWKILDKNNIGLDIDTLSSLRDKKVAIDLSGWILQSSQVQCGQSTISNLPLRNLFWRVYHLVKNQATPVFVIEGQPPELKRIELNKRMQNRAKSAERKRNGLAGESCTPGTNGEEQANKRPAGVKSRFKKLTKECCELLDLMGVSYIQAQGEAEATCAWLSQHQLVDGVITDDSDAFLFGAQIVYRHFTCMDNKPSFTSYSMADVKRVLGTERADLVAMALLLGCDYGAVGARGIGAEKVLKLLAEIRDRDEPLNLLQRFDDWKMKASDYDELESYKSCKKPRHCVVCKHSGTKATHRQDGCERCYTEADCRPVDPSVTAAHVCTCDYHLNLMRYAQAQQEVKVRREVLSEPTFPKREVIDAYLLPDSAVADPEIVWRQPDFERLKEFLSRKLHWKEDSIETHVSQLMSAYATSTVLASQSTAEDVPPSTPVPHRILKETTRKGVSVYHVLWRHLYGNSDPHTTVEVAEMFRKSFPDIASAYENEQGKKSEKKNKGKGVRRRGSLLLRDEPNQPKINQLFKAKKPARRDEPLHTTTKQELDAKDDQSAGPKCAAVASEAQMPNQTRVKDEFVPKTADSPSRGNPGKVIDYKNDMKVKEERGDVPNRQSTDKESVSAGSVKTEAGSGSHSSVPGCYVPEIIEILDFDEIKIKTEIKAEKSRDDESDSDSDGSVDSERALGFCSARGACTTGKDGCEVRKLSLDSSHRTDFQEEPVDSPWAIKREGGCSARGACSSDREGYGVKKLERGSAHRTDCQRQPVAAQWAIKGDTGSIWRQDGTPDRQMTKKAVKKRLWFSGSPSEESRDSGKQSNSQESKQDETPDLSHSAGADSDAESCQDIFENSTEIENSSPECTQRKRSDLAKQRSQKQRSQNENEENQISVGRGVLTAAKLNAQERATGSSPAKRMRCCEAQGSKCAAMVAGGGPNMAEHNSIKGLTMGVLHGCDVTLGSTCDLPDLPEFVGHSLSH